VPGQNGFHPVGQPALMDAASKVEGCYAAADGDEGDSPPCGGISQKDRVCRIWFKREDQRRGNKEFQRTQSEKDRDKRVISFYHSAGVISIQLRAMPNRRASGDSAVMPDG